MERLLIPTLEARVRSIVTEEFAKFEKTLDARFDSMDARFEALDSKMDARFEAAYAKIDSIEKQFPTVKELAEIKARLNAIEKSSR